MKPGLRATIAPSGRRRRILAALAASTLLGPAFAPLARAAPPKVLGILAHGGREETLAFHEQSMRRQLAEFGWVEGRTLRIEWRFGEGDPSRFPALARELVALHPDVIATASTQRTRVLVEATRTIPILTVVGDPVGSGFAESLARPGRNVTGLSLGTIDVAQKQADMLRAAVPRLAKVAILRGPQSTRHFAEAAEREFRILGVDARIVTVATLADAEAAFRELPRGRGAAFIFGEVIGAGATDEVLQLAIRHRVPLMAGNDDFVKRGALLAYTLEHADADRRMASMVDRVLRGADPATIPFELPDKSALFINRRTATAIGLALPPDFALRATHVFHD
jgi:putative ABC transport system substrate-binding protein